MSTHSFLFFTYCPHGGVALALGLVGLTPRLGMLMTLLSSPQQPTYFLRIQTEQNMLVIPQILFSVGSPQILISVDSYIAIIPKVFDEMSKLISPPPKLIILLWNNKAYPISIT